MSNGLELQKVRAGSMRGVKGTDDIGPYALYRVEGCGGGDGEHLYVMEDCKIGGEGIGRVLGPNMGKDLEDGMDASDGMRVGSGEGRAPPALPIRDKVPSDREAPTSVEGERRVVPQRAAELAMTAGDCKFSGGVVDAHKVGWDREGRESPDVLARLLEPGKVLGVHLEDSLGFREGMPGNSSVALKVLEGFTKDHGDGATVKGISCSIELADLGQIAQRGVVFNTEDAGALGCAGGAESVSTSVVSNPLSRSVGNVLLLRGPGGRVAVLPDEVPPGSESLWESGADPRRHAILGDVIPRGLKVEHVLWGVLVGGQSRGADRGITDTHGGDGVWESFGPPVFPWRGAEGREDEGAGEGVGGKDPPFACHGGPV